MRWSLPLVGSGSHDLNSAACCSDVSPHLHVPRAELTGIGDGHPLLGFPPTPA